VKFDEVREMLMLLSQTGAEECFRSISKEGREGFCLWVGRVGEGPPMGFINVSNFKDWIMREHGPKAKSHPASGQGCR